MKPGYITVRELLGFLAICSPNHNYVGCFLDSYPVPNRQSGDTSPRFHVIRAGTLLGRKRNYINAEYLAHSGEYLGDTGLVHPLDSMRLARSITPDEPARYVAPYDGHERRQPIGDVHDVIVRCTPQRLRQVALRPDYTRYLWTEIKQRKQMMFMCR